MPIRPRQTATTAALASVRRRLERRPATVLPAVGDGVTSGLSLADEVDDGEQADPDDVDEVPVVRHDDGGSRLARGERAERAADEQEDERDEPAHHVQAVEARRYVVDGPVAMAG